MYIILLFHEDGDITAVMEWNGAIKVFTQAEAVRFIQEIDVEGEGLEYKVIAIRR